MYSFKMNALIWDMLRSVALEDEEVGYRGMNMGEELEKGTWTWIRGMDMGTGRANITVMIMVGGRD